MRWCGWSYLGADIKMIMNVNTNTKQYVADQGRKVTFDDIECFELLS